MTPQERELLTTFLQQMTQARAGQKDAEAEALIRDAASRQPDALYLLTQRALGLDYAMQASQAQMAKLQAEIDQLRDQLRQPAATPFLADPNAWGRSAPAASPVVMTSSASTANADLAPLAPLGSGTLQRNSPQAMAPAQGMRSAAPASSWGGAGILGSVATTAAGVVAGGLLYLGISSMMHHNDPSPVAAAKPPEPAAFNDTALDDSLDDADDYADADSGDFDSGDAA